MFAAAPLVFGLGTVGILYTFIGWWRDVIREAQYEGFHTRVVQISHRYGMILFIASEVMFFVAWFWAYFNTALFPGDVHDYGRLAITHGVWPPQGIETFNPWHLPLLNTLILLTSGTTVTWAHHALLENDRQGLKWGLALTILLGLTFTCVQAYEYAHAAFHYSGNIYGATFFMATGFHGAHVIIGSIFLIVCLFRAHATGTSRPPSISASSSPPGTGISSTWCGCSCSPAYMCGAPACRIPSDRLTMALREGGVIAPPFCFTERARTMADEPLPIARGLRGRCPHCGEGKLFQGFLTLRPRCDHCGLDYSFADAGDGPAVFVILLGGALVVFAALITEVAYQPPYWVHAVLWVPLILLVTLAPLRPIKGLMIALQYHHRAQEGRLIKRDGE